MKIDKILLQINKGKNEELKLIINETTEIERRAIINLMEHLIKEMNKTLNVELEEKK